MLDTHFIEVLKLINIVHSNGCVNCSHEQEMSYWKSLRKKFLNVTYLYGICESPEAIDDTAEC